MFRVEEHFRSMDFYLKTQGWKRLAADMCMTGFIALLVP